MTDLTTQIKARKKSKVNNVVVTQSLLNLIAKHAARTHGFQNGLTELLKLKQQFLTRMNLIPKQH